jgi:hypothetical protein
VSRDALEALEASELDVGIAIAWLVRDDVGFDQAELNAARRRAMLVLAAGGDPHRDLDHGDVAAARMADELDTPERRAALDRALARLDTSGLAKVAKAVEALRSDPDAAWRMVALALLADELAEG